MKEVENSLRKDIVEKVKDTHGNRALWISKRWWRYRPKLPYTYFLQKLDSSEVIIPIVHPSVSVFLLGILEFGDFELYRQIKERTGDLFTCEKIGWEKRQSQDGAM